MRPASAPFIFFVNKNLDETRDNMGIQLKNSIAEQEKKTEAAVTEVKKQLNQELAKQQEITKKLDESTKATVVDLTKLRSDHDVFVKADAEVRKKHDDAIAATSSDLVKTNTVVNKVETDVKYLKENVAKLEGRLGTIDQAIKTLGDGSAALKEELKKEQAALASEVAAVSKKGGVTDEELRKLENKTLEFQVKVLNERARLAQLAAKKNDNKAVLDLLDLK